MALYNERVYAYERMCALNVELEEDPDKAGQMVANDLSNHLAFVELSNYNEHGRFLYKHPILAAYKIENELEKLRKVNPAGFMTDLVNADKNVTRYRSQLKNKKYKNEVERQSWLRLIEEYTTKLVVMKELISR